MADTATTIYQPMRAVRVLRRGVEQAISLPIYDVAHALVEPDEGAFTLLDPSGSVVVDARSVDLVDGVAVVTVDGSDIPTSTTAAGGWLEVWDLVVDGETVTIRREAAVSKSCTIQPVTVHDLQSYMPGFGSLLPWSWLIEEATAEVFGTVGDPWRLVSTVGSVACIRHLAAALAYEGAGIDYAGQAAYQRELYAGALKRWVLRYETDEGVSSVATGCVVRTRRRRVIS